jgi:hypothetical protein
MMAMRTAFPLPILLRNGERVRVRGGHKRRSKRLPLTPTLSPHALGLVVEGSSPWMARGQAGRGRLPGVPP